MTGAVEELRIITILLLLALDFLDIPTASSVLPGPLQVNRAPQGDKGLPALIRFLAQGLRLCCSEAVQTRYKQSLLLFGRLERCKFEVFRHSFHQKNFDSHLCSVLGYSYIDDSTLCSAIIMEKCCHFWFYCWSFSVLLNHIASSFTCGRSDHILLFPCGSGMFYR